MTTWHDRTKSSGTAPNKSSDDGKCSALKVVLDCVAATGYRFTTPTPLTHRIVLKNRTGAAAKSLRDIFGWNLPFAAQTISPILFEAMKAAGILSIEGEQYKTTLRIATLDGELFLHSCFPTTQEDTVFFGPDTYRFARLIRQSLQHCPPHLPVQRILDIGCGSGAGGIMSARTLIELGLVKPDKLDVVMNDINLDALRLTEANALSAKIPIKTVLGDAFAVVAGQFDLIVCNPPYLDDGDERLYRHGGSGLGRALGLRLAEEALSHLAPGGRLVLYTGVAIVDGVDKFIRELEPILRAGRYDWHYEEIDPDIFGEELLQTQYKSAERIAAVGLTAIRSS